MTEKLIMLSVPALRDGDLRLMPELSKLVANGSKSRIRHSFPAVTWPSQANMLTGQPPSAHGVTSNGFYWRDSRKVEMWTAWNEVIEQPQIWDRLAAQGIKSAAWFPMLSKGCGADFVCMPAPIHKPDGSEDLWCYTKPQEYYGTLLEALGHFPLQHFWGPMANIKSSKWIVDSAAMLDAEYDPDFWYVYVPHLDYAAQKNGPDSQQAIDAVGQLDALIGDFTRQMQEQNDRKITWMIASEYVITPVDHFVCPNRILREAGLLKVAESDSGEQLDLQNSLAWALVDHQFSHIYVRDADTATIKKVVDLFSGMEGIDSVFHGAGQGSVGMNHERSGEVILLSTPTSWQAYYWWLDDARAPDFAGTVDIHRKPGYDPVELCFDMANKRVPLDAGLIHGSHGAPAASEDAHGVLVTNDAGFQSPAQISDFDIFDLVLSKMLPE